MTLGRRRRTSRAHRHAAAIRRNASAVHKSLPVTRLRIRQNRNRRDDAQGAGCQSSTFPAARARVRELLRCRRAGYNATESEPMKDDSIDYRRKGRDERSLST